MYAILIISPLSEVGVISWTYIGTLLIYYSLRIFLHGKESRKKSSYFSGPVTKATKKGFPNYNFVIKQIWQLGN